MSQMHDKQDMGAGRWQELYTEAYREVISSGHPDGGCNDSEAHYGDAVAQRLRAR